MSVNCEHGKGMTGQDTVADAMSQMMKGKFKSESIYPQSTFIYLARPTDDQLLVHLLHHYLVFINVNKHRRANNHDLNIKWANRWCAPWCPGNIVNRIRHGRWLFTLVDVSTYHRRSHPFTHSVHASYKSWFARLHSTWLLSLDINFAMVACMRFEAIFFHAWCEIFKNW